MERGDRDDDEREEDDIELRLQTGDGVTAGCTHPEGCGYLAGGGR
jgi:hypothetical protein